MQAFDDRIVRVSIELNGQLYVYEQLQLRASGQKYGNSLQDECEVRISNMTRANRDFLLTETSPFNGNKTPKKLIVEAGRKSTGVHRLFEGDITQVSPSQPPDITLIIKAKTSQFAKGELVVNAKDGVTDLSVIAADVAKSMGLTLTFEATDKKIGSYSYSGPKLQQIEKLAQAGGVDAFIDGQVLVVKDANVPLQNVVHELSAESGMVGIPEITEQGVKVRYLLDPQSRTGGALALRSELNPAATGNYTIYKLSFDVSNRDTPFYNVAECKRA